MKRRGRSYMKIGLGLGDLGLGDYALKDLNLKILLVIHI